MPSLWSRFVSRVRAYLGIEKAVEPELITPREPMVPSPPVEKEPIFPVEEGIEEVEIPEEIPEEIPTEEKKLVKVVTFYERIRDTRIRRKVERAYPVETSDSEINSLLDTQYDRGGNFVIGIETIDTKEGIVYEEQEIERGKPGSADVSP
jgi:hypothetical protein